MKYGTIYKIINLINGKEYVGQTTNSVFNRFVSHCSEKGYTFFYLKDYANQSGSTESNILEHAQRIGIETASAE